MTRSVLLAALLLTACAEPEVRAPPQLLAPTARSSTSPAASASAPAPVTSASATASATPSSEPASLPEDPALSGAKTAAVAAVAKHPEVREYCETLKIKHGLTCLMWVNEVPEDKCEPGPVRAVDPCNYGVYVGENQGTHASRFATFYVRPGSWTVVGVSDFACADMSVGEFKRLRAARLRAKPDEAVPCPGE